jgi:hypothetical protein
LIDRAGGVTISCTRFRPQSTRPESSAGLPDPDSPVSAVAGQGCDGNLHFWQTSSAAPVIRSHYPQACRNVSKLRVAHLGSLPILGQPIVSEESWLDRVSISLRSSEASGALYNLSPADPFSGERSKTTHTNWSARDDRPSDTLGKGGFRSPAQICLNLLNTEPGPAAKPGCECYG